MLFPSFTFLLGFLPLTVMVYFLLTRWNGVYGRIWLVAASLVFYSWFNPSYGLILGGSVAGNWIFARILYRRKSLWLLWLGILCNVFMLGYFKYYDFFVENVNMLFGSSFMFKHILLPLGISFFTFQQISFLQMVYDGSLEDRYTFSEYALFVCFFPQLIAGPIVLPDEMMSQFSKEENLHVNSRNIAAGLYTFALGLGKKILLADFFAAIADKGFEVVSGNFFEGWCTALAYTFQIYFDFSGYCDMAIGIGLLFNIRLPGNFNAPYRAENITDFWKRWHMTLGRFLLSSLYIPLGGNRHGRIRTCINLLITFFISGLWHGASYLFILWGMLHGGAMVLHRIWKEYLHWCMPLFPARILTFFFVMLAWIPFRAESMQKVCALYKSMFLPSSWKLLLPSGFELTLFAVGFWIILFLTPVPELEKRFRPTWINAVLTVGLILGSMFLFVKTSPFIYFNF